MVTYGRRNRPSALLRQTNSLKCKHIYKRTKLPILLQLYSFNIRVCAQSISCVLLCEHANAMENQLRAHKNIKYARAQSAQTSKSIC